MASMSLPTWECALLPLADEAEHREGTPPPFPVRDPALLARAYACCTAITSRHSRTFSTATSLLPEAKRQATRSLYAFCRVSDDLVDCSRADAKEALATWRYRALALAPPSSDLVAVAWAEIRRRYGIPQRYVEQLLDGVAQDLHPQRYHTFAEVATYAYGVASTVGLMSMHIIGFAGEQAIPYAIKLGIALQLTNILRDIGEDWRAGRVYLPTDEMGAYGLTEADLERGQAHERWRAFLGFQIARNRRLYEESIPGIALLHRDGRFAVAAASELYRAILDDIEAHDYDVVHYRAHVRSWNKARALPGIWWRSRAGWEKRGEDDNL